MKMNIYGKIYRIEEKKEVSQGFTVRSFYLDVSTVNTTAGDVYVNILKFQLKNNTDLLNDLAEGDEVSVEFGISGRFYNRKDGSGESFIQNLNAYRITRS